MPIEKDLKNNSENLNSNKVETQKSFFKLKKLFDNHRLQSKQKFLLKPINFSTFITFLPFALGFAEFVYKKQTFEKYHSFFQKNLPAFRVLNPKINYETFEYISKSNFLTSGEKNFQDFSPKKTEIQRFGDKTMFLETFSQPNFVAKRKKPKSIPLRRFNGLLCNFDTLNSSNFLSSNKSIESFYKNLDELPSYLKGISQKKQLSENNFLLPIDKLAPFSTFPNKEYLETTTFLKASKETNKFPKQKLFFKTQSSVQKKLNLINRVTRKVNSFSLNNLQITNEFYKNRYRFYQNFSQFNVELQNLFLEKNSYVLPSFVLQKNSTLNEQEFNFLKKRLTNISEVDDTVLLEKILQKFSKTTLSEDFPGVRLMSGYNYPDMSNYDLYWFSLQKAFIGKFVSPGLTCQNSTILSSSKKYNFTIKNLPRVLIETKKLIFTNLDDNRIFYNGPTLFLDSQKALDWKSHGEENLRSWFHAYVSPSNPIIQFRDNFFGIYYSPEFGLQPKNKNKGLIADFLDFSKKSFFSLKYNSGEAKWYPAVASLKSNFAPFNYSLHIPYEIDSASNEKNVFKTKTSVPFVDKQEVFIRGLDLNFSNTEDASQTEHFVPVIQLQQPKFTSLSKDSNNFNLSSHFFETGLLPKVDYTLPTECFNEKDFVLKSVSGRYKKISSIFSRTTKSSPVLIDNWEPLTSNSWLVVSQLSFAVFIFQVLKALADNYGRELLGYLLDLVSALGVLDDSLKQEIEILMGQREKGFRIILKSRKNFTNIAGIEKLLPEIYELVWFLRNSAREFALSKTLPRGVLLTGPPGTGKTLLVQALAGEAQVPVLVLSGSSLIEPGESGALKLEMLFQEARQLAPCIVFIDEIDTLAQKRSGVVQNPMGPDELLESLTSFENSTSGSPLDFLSQFHEKEKSDTQLEISNQAESKQDQLSLLMQFLIELDGIQGRDGVIVIGATNRPEVLDPAILRPGRFDKILQVGLPGHQKRIEILKLYGQALGYQSEITWDYLGQRTAGFTAADLATLMNESSIKAILNQSAHTIETIEHGIDRITTSQSDKYLVLKTKSGNTFDSVKSGKFLSFSSKISLLRLAYYQAGKIVVSHILKTHPKVLVAYLWPRRTTIRSLQITTNLQNSVFQFARLVELNERIIGSYAGKAAEFLFLENFSKCESNPTINGEKNEFLSTSQFSTLSTLGIDDLLFAQKLIYCLIEKWSFYSKKFKIQKTINLVSNVNTREFAGNKEKIEFYNNFLESIQTPPMTEALETQTSSLFSNKEKLVPNYNAQMYYSIPWWQKEISSELEFVEKNFANWSRIYLSNPEQSERNPEWLPPDEFYHSTSGLKNVKKAFKNLSIRKTRKTEKNIVKSNLQSKKINLIWNDVSKITRDYPVHSLVLQGFNKTLSILNQNRELLDTIVIELLYKEILREPELDKIFADFPNLNTTIKSPENTTPNLLMQELSAENTQIKCEICQQDKSFQILESYWGLQSRKKLPRWIDFKNLK